GTDFSQVDRLIDEAYARTRAFLQAGGLDSNGRLEPGIHYMLPPRHQTSSHWRSDGRRQKPRPPGEVAAMAVAARPAAGRLADRSASGRGDLSRHAMHGEGRHRVQPGLVRGAVHSDGCPAALAEPAADSG